MFARVASLALFVPLAACAHGTVSDGGIPHGGDAAAMVRVAAGPFLRGSTEGDMDGDYQECVRVEGDDCARSWFEDEGPQRTLELSGFWIDQYEVTNAQFESCIVSGGCKPIAVDACETWGEGGWQAAERDWVLNRFGGERYPRVCVTWYDAKDYCAWAGKRLPTEAEWEKAARGTDGRRFPWGDEPATCERAQMKEGDDVDGCGKDGTAEVGSFANAKSPYGALDMAGNVHEWVLDTEDPGYYEHAPATDPAHTEGGGARVIRGGSWSSSGSWVRAANRGGFNPDVRNIYTGFRCAMTGG